MAQHSGTATSPRSTSHLASLIDQIELILTSPADFSSTTSQLTLPPLLRRLYDIDYVSEENERLTRIERWCGELGDATRAAYARETITLFLEEVEQWGEWEWSSPTEQVEVRKRRINDINRSLGELPIEWLKSRVQELRKDGKEMNPPAYLAIHITFSLLPPLSTLYAHLQLYTIRFRIFTISQTFFSIVQKLKSFISVPTIFHTPAQPHHPELSASDALTLTVEAGMLLDQMIDLSVEAKTEPIPDIWIDEFEKLEFMIGRITKEDDGVLETPCPTFAARDVGGRVGESPESMRTLSTRVGGMDSVFSTPRREDSMSSVEEELPDYLRVNGKYEEPEEEEEKDEGGDFDLVTEMRRIAFADDDGVKIKQEEEEYEGLIDPQLRMINPHNEDIKVKEEEDDAFDEGLLGPALQRIARDQEDAEIKPEEEELEVNDITHNPSEFHDSPLSESEQVHDFDNESAVEYDFKNGEDVRDEDENIQIDAKAADDNLDVEEQLLLDDDRIFEEYHAIATPPNESTDEIDHSPFLARVIAELEDLEPLETLAESYPYDTEDGPIDADDEIDEILQDGDDSFDQDADFDDEEIEGDEEFSTSVEIRTSSPLYENRNLNYDQLESDSDDQQEQINSDDDDDDDNDETTTFDKTIILDTFPTPSSPPQHLCLDPFSPDPPPPTHKHTTYPSSSSSSSSPPSPDQTITLPPTITTRKHPHLTPRTPTPPPSLPPLDPTTPPSLRTSHLHSKVSAIAHSLPTIALIPHPSHTTFKPTVTSPEYGYYTLHSRRPHSRQSSVSSVEEARKVDVQGQNLYVRVLSDRVMVRVGGGWVDLEQYLREYIGKRRGGRRRSGSVASSSTGGGGEYEFLDLDSVEGRSGTPGSGRATSSLGVYSSPPRSASVTGNASGRISSMDLRRSVSPMGFADDGTVGKVSGGSTRRMFVRRKQT